MKKYYLIENYACKCRLYPNKTQAKQIDEWLDAARLFHNLALYDILVNHNPNILTEKVDKDNPERVVHWINFSNLGKASYINILREKEPRIDRIPGAALNSSVFGVVNDMKKSWETTGKHPIENFGKEYIGKDGNTHRIGISYYSKKKPRKSLTYQASKSNIFFTENKNVIKIKLSSRNYPIEGLVKIRGFNNDLRFDDKYQMTFEEWLKDAKKKLITITISKDTVGDYFICFHLNNVYKSINEQDCLAEETGVDVGEIDLITSFDGENYYKSGNLIEHNRKVSKERQAIICLNKKLSRKEGWENPDFLKRRKKNKDLQVSKSYEYSSLQKNKLLRKITRQRKDFQSKEVIKLINQSSNISIETLKVKDMYDK